MPTRWSACWAAASRGSGTTVDDSAATAAVIRVGHDSTVTVKGLYRAAALGTSDWKSLTPTGLDVSLGSGSTLEFDGDLEVLAYHEDEDGLGEAYGMNVESAGGTTMAVNGSVVLRSQAPEATGRGIYISGGAGDVVRVDADIQVEAADEAIGIDYRAGRAPEPEGQDGEAPPVVIDLTGDITVRSGAGDDGSYGVRLSLADGAAVELANRGTIDAGNGHGIHAVGEGAFTLANHGGIAGTLDLRAGHVAVVLSETSRVEGAVSLNGNTNRATLYAGTVLNGTLDGGCNGELYLKGARTGGGETELADVHSFRRAEVDGGHWIIKTDASIDTMSIRGGRVTVDGSFQGQKVNLAGGVLSGNGAIVADVHAVSGQVSPGGSIGALQLGPQRRGAARRRRGHGADGAERLHHRRCGDRGAGPGRRLE